MKRQRWSVGFIVKIPLLHNQHSYGQLLSQGSIAVFDIITDKELEISKIIKNDLLFIVTIYSDVIPSGRWLKMSKAEINQQLSTLPMKFIQDPLDSDAFELYDPNTGDIRKATRKECEGLERSSIWAAEHVESRIRDHFAAKENTWVQQLTMK